MIKTNKLTFNHKPLTIRGFTLVELLVVMSIIGVLASLGVGSYMNAQLRGRDAQRKSDLKQISNALEIYYSDHGTYPNANLIVAGSVFTDGKTVYFKEIPDDPSPSLNYVYRVVDSPTNKKYQLFTYLENTKDQDLITTTRSCGAKTCNFAITSANTNASE